MIQSNIFFFFFSSRRRHTRLQGDWSSDVCSSDLTVASSPSAIASSRTSGAGWNTMVQPNDCLLMTSINRTEDRKSTRLNSSHLVISYAVFCLKKKKRTNGSTNEVRFTGLCHDRVE